MKELFNMVTVLAMQGFSVDSVTICCKRHLEFATQRNITKNRYNQTCYKEILRKIADFKWFLRQFCYNVYNDCPSPSDTLTRHRTLCCA